MSTINRFLSRRERLANGAPGKNAPKSSNGPLNGLFVDDDTERKVDKEDEKKISAVSHRLSQAGIKAFDDADINYVLKSEYAKGDTSKAYELLSILQDTEDGIIRPYNLDVKLLGAVNRSGVTCYLDALLFAMFARLGSFEAMLYKHFEDPPRKRLATLLRLWVNILRSGKLITVDITKQIQLQLAACGWKEAGKLCQQDASEAFTFITGTLALPLLTLKMDIYHTGREDASDDHKFINERLLELAIPEEPEDGHAITLEECLEMFFNNKIEVKRYLDSLERRNTIGSVRSTRSIDSSKVSNTHIEVAEIEEGQPSSPVPWSPMAPPSPSSVRPVARRRAPSIIQETFIDEKRGYNGYPVDPGDEKRGHHRRVRKEVMMPAWQFFSLIPWYTNNVPANDAQVAQHFSSTRPILGICLKRYYMMANGKAAKRSTHIDIPLEIALPHFIQDDNMSEDGPAFGNFKLSLQSVVCHQGISVESGHYICLVRSPDPDGGDGVHWLRHDDLAAQRVTSIDAEQFLKESNQQTPYLLFYQVMPIEDDGSSASFLNKANPAVNDEPPPSYADSIGSRDSKFDLPATANIETARASLDYSNRASLDLQTSNESYRGRSSQTFDRALSTAFSEQTITSSTNSNPTELKIDVHPPLQQQQQQQQQQPDSGRDSLDASNALLNSSGPNSLTADRRGSRSSKTSSKSRDASRSDERTEKRMSASLSRLASKITRDRSSHSSHSSNTAPVPSTAPTSVLSIPPTLLPTVPASPAPLTNDTPPLHFQSQPQKAATDPIPPSQPHIQDYAPSLSLEPDKDKDRDKTDTRTRSRGRLKKDKARDAAAAAAAAAAMPPPPAPDSTHNHHHHSHHHHHLSKTDLGDAAGDGEKGKGKPERECAVM